MYYFQMLDIKLIRENPDLVKHGLASKRVDSAMVDQFLTLDEEWRNLTKESEDLRAQQKKLSGQDVAEEARKIKSLFQELDTKLTAVAAKRDSLLLEFPNIPFDDALVGKDESENRVVREAGDKPDFRKFEPKDYLTLAKIHDLIDIDRAGVVSGSRFGYLKNEAVLLEFALIELAFKTAIKAGFTPMIPPVMIRPEIMQNMGKGKFIEEHDAFYVSEDNLYLVGSSEHSIGPYHQDFTFNESDLPKRYVGFSTCFRREAGSYGKDTKGILRVHQFDKVEMLAFSKPEESEGHHIFMVNLQEELMKKLELPFRVMEICTGDMTFADARQFDIETWIPSENRFRETHSCSNTTDYQSRGINARYRDKTDGTNYVHMLNGTVFAIGRTLIAIIENYQTKDGKIKIPKVLQDYVGKKEIG